ncbi:alpha/beta-hydrolase [Macrolepiota fuliginosa MF-IS2]|uniref:Alpha/beta-hydrolase n=1 Tax=Macrolepiota fuliginosa MF-IS2 TaxID=1400762 RepID=A0A9P5XHK7_9AGAR|nr:alpha/beta-hydrolase [Macrolepiota fuliginosa MF-IS2]
MDISSFTQLKPRFVKSADGTEIYADAAGTRSPAVPVLILIHGFSMRKEAFDPMFKDPQWLSNSFLVRYDGRGQGRSGKPLTDAAWEPRRISEDFEAVCKEFGVKRAFVLGWSVGASQFVDIINYNTSNSVAISGLINISGAMYSSPTIISRMTRPETCSFILDLTQTTNVDAFQSATLRFCSLLSEHLSPDLYRILLEGIMLVPRGVASRLTSRVHDPEKMLKQARDGELELLLVTGGKDKLVDAEGIRGTFDESGWKLYIHKHIEGADHMPWVSTSDEFRDIVLGWIRGRHC